MAYGVLSHNYLPNRENSPYRYASENNRNANRAEAKKTKTQHRSIGCSGVIPSTRGKREKEASASEVVDVVSAGRINFVQGRSNCNSDIPFSSAPMTTSQVRPLLLYWLDPRGVHLHRFHSLQISCILTVDLSIGSKIIVINENQVHQGRVQFGIKSAELYLRPRKIKFGLYEQYQGT